MSKRVRVRCPTCGMLVTQDRLNRDYDFEFVIQEITSKGKGSIKNEYSKSQVSDSEGAKVYQYMVGMKLLDKAQKLFDEIGEDIEIEVHIPEEAEEEIGEDYEESISEIDYETEEVVTAYEPAYQFEMELGEVGFEAEVENEIEADDVKKKSFWKRLFGRKDKRVEKAMSELGEIVYEADDIKFEIESEYRKEE